MALLNWQTERRSRACRARVPGLLTRARVLSGLLLGTLLAATPLTLAQTEQSGVGEQRSEVSIENLRAFAKLYGYVRYFHPSDAASSVDWERFAVHGITQVENASSPAELKGTLEALFEPLAPTVQLYTEGEPPPAPHASLTPEDTTGLAFVAWQHRGLGNPGPYRSRRLNRLSDTPRDSSFGTVIQTIDAAPYRGMEIKLEGAVRAEVQGSGNRAQLWLRVDRPGEQMGFFDNMQDRPVTSSEWGTYTITGEVAGNAEEVAFGGFLFGEGKAYFDSFRLSVREDNTAVWRPVPLENPGFEADDPGDPPTGWRKNPPDYRFLSAAGGAFEGESALAIFPDRETREQEIGPLFDARPGPGEVVEKSLGHGLMVQLPLALYSRGGQTLRPDDAPSLEPLIAELGTPDMTSLSAEDDALRYANVVMAWNIFQHFYPYFDVIEADWDAVLTETLRRAEDDRTSEDLLYTLRWMVAQLGDGHGRVNHPVTEHEAGLPFLVDEVEGQIVVVATAEEVESCLQRGDVVVSLDGTPVEQVLTDAKVYISGSPQWKTVRALREFGRGQRGTQARLLLKRPGETLTCEVARRYDGSIQEARPEPIEELREGIYYVDLSRTSISTIIAERQALAAAKGIVFDLRGYPDSNHDVLRYLTENTLRSAHWQKPQLIYPDQEDRVGYDTSGRWNLVPGALRFTGKIVFLTDARAISYAESVMGIVEHYALGEIVGRPTAGANGDVNPFTLPGGYSFYWTGMRVVKHDGSQHHLVGIQPTVPVARTLEGVREGRDEDLERALELIEASRSESTKAP